jgi:hypothetical protein
LKSILVEIAIQRIIFKIKIKVQVFHKIREPSLSVEDVEVNEIEQNSLDHLSYTRHTH